MRRWFGWLTITENHKWGFGYDSETYEEYYFFGIPIKRKEVSLSPESNKGDE